MKRWIWALIPAFAMLSLLPAQAQEEKPQPIAIIIFEPELYEAYQEWAKKKVGELEELAAQARTISPQVEDVEFRGWCIRAGDPQELREFALSMLTAEPEIGDDGRRRITVLPHPLPEEWPADAGPDLVYPIIREFRKHFSEEAFRVAREKQGRKVRSLLEEIDRLEKLREKEPTFEGNTEEDIRARLVAAQEAMLKVELDKAEAEARRLEALKKLEEVQAKGGWNTAGGRALEVAEKKLAQAQEMHKQGLVPASDLLKAEEELAKLKMTLELTAKPASPTEQRLTEVIVDAEIDLAGIRARLAVLDKHEEHLSLLAERAEHERRELSETLSRLTRELEEVRDNAPREDDFRLDQPTIEWAEKVEPPQAP